jgi:hypothetical protein
MTAPELKVIRSEDGSIQFDVDGVLVTISTDNSSHIVAGSVALTMEGDNPEGAWVVSFHMDEDRDWTVHEPEYHEGILDEEESA